MTFFKLISADNWNFTYKVEVGSVDNPAKPLLFVKMSYNHEMGMLVTMSDTS